MLASMDALRKRAKNIDLGRVFRASGNFSVAGMLTPDADPCKANPVIDPLGSLVDDMMYVMIELIGPMTVL